MSDTSPWQSPSGPDPLLPPAGGQTPPPPPGFPPPPGVPVGPGSAPAWTPPPRPGLIPLQPMTLGTILGASFRVLRRNPRPTFGLSLLIQGVTVVLGVGTVALVFFFAFGRLENAASTSAQADIANGSIALLLLAYLVPITLGVFGLAITQGVFSIEVARGTVGEKLTLGGLWRRARGRLGALIGWFWAIVGIAIFAYVLVVIVLSLIIVAGGVAGVIIGIVLGILLFLGALVLIGWLSTKLSMVPAVLMLERLTLGKAIARSWRLTTGNFYFWRTLGIELLVLFIIETATSVVSAPIEVIFVAVTALFNQTGAQSTAITLTVVVGAITVVVTVVLGAVASVVQSSTTALLYIDLRIRKEALDLDLIRFVEARQAGDDSVPDPYLVAQGSTPSGAAPPQPAPPPIA
ncbi:MAG TPA: hypothetical protein VHZ81_07490 [Galbitalea sp.]|nr:hypothetical protein [Galbitalea sp.]